MAPGMGAPEACFALPCAQGPEVQHVAAGLGTWAWGARKWGWGQPGAGYDERSVRWRMLESKQRI